MVNFPILPIPQRTNDSEITTFVRQQTHGTAHPLAFLAAGCNRRVCCSGVIVAELMQGAKSEKELDVLREFANVFEFLPEMPKVWQAAGELSFRLQRKGKTMGISDCLIAVAAREGGAEILSLDAYFEEMKAEVAIRLFKLAP